MAKSSTESFQAGDDGFALVGDAFALEAFGFGFRFSLLDEEHLVGFGAGDGGFAFALRGVDVIHCGFYFEVGDDVGDEDFDDGVAVLLHGSVEVVAQIGGDGGLIEEGIVELHFGDVAEDDVIDHGLDLLDGIGKLVICGFDGIRNHFVLDRDGDLDEDVVLRFRFHFHVELLDLHAHALDDRFDVRRFPIESGAGDAREFAEALNDGDLGSLDGEEGTEDHAQNENHNDYEENEEKHAFGAHVFAPYREFIEREFDKRRRVGVATETESDDDRGLRPSRLGNRWMAPM